MKNEIWIVLWVFLCIAFAACVYIGTGRNPWLAGAAFILGISTFRVVLL